jgi:Cof subfamily protein (haloacid dehalogenase superfamily)
MDRSITTYFADLRQRVSEAQLSSFKIAAFDMDGTLLNRNHQLSSRTIESVKMIADAGLLVLIATGRMTRAIRNHIENLGASELVVSHNGALVKDVKTGQIYHHEAVSRNVIAKVLELQEGKDTIIHFNFDDEIYLTAPNPYSDQYSQELEVPLTYIRSLREFRENPTTVLLIDRKDVLQQVLIEVSNQLTGQFDCVLAPWRGDIWRLQFLAAGTSKGKGVLQVAKRLGIEPEEIISFGDNYNDMEMLQQTGLGIAMGNSVPELKQVADFITLSNQEDGVALALEALFNPWNK